MRPPAQAEHWRAFCAAATAPLHAGANSGAAAASSSSAYRERIPQLAARLESVLAPALGGTPASAGALCHARLAFIILQPCAALPGRLKHLHNVLQFCRQRSLLVTGSSCQQGLGGQRRFAVIDQVHMQGTMCSPLLMPRIKLAEYVGTSIKTRTFLQGSTI